MQSTHRGDIHPIPSSLCMSCASSPSAFHETALASHRSVGDKARSLADVSVRAP